jgi:hypothetical protein
MITNRRLAAIMVADIVGYSRLWEADDVGTLAALKIPARSPGARPTASSGFDGSLRIEYS